MSQAGGQAEETQMALEITRKSWNLFAPTVMKCFQFSSSGIFRYYFLKKLDLFMVNRFVEFVTCVIVVDEKFYIHLP